MILLLVVLRSLRNLAATTGLSLVRGRLVLLVVSRVFHDLTLFVAALLVELELGGILREQVLKLFLGQSTTGDASFRTHLISPDLEDQLEGDRMVMAIGDVAGLVIVDLKPGSHQLFTNLRKGSLIDVRNLALLKNCTKFQNS